jgi:type II secretory pathway component PulC
VGEKFFAAVSLCALLCAGCATASSPGSAPPASAPAAEAAGGDHLIATAAVDPTSEAAVPAAAPASCAARADAEHLRRSAIKRTVDAGLGRWLQTVSVDPLLAHGRFRGWIIRSFNSDDVCFAGIDVRTGDVVTRVNGRPVERPEEALDVWSKLPSSPELVIDLLRDGQARRVRFGIVDP